MYSLRSKTSPFPCNVAVTLWIPCTPNFLPAAASSNLCLTSPIESLLRTVMDMVSPSSPGAPPRARGQPVGAGTGSRPGGAEQGDGQAGGAAAAGRARLLRVIREALVRLEHLPARFAPVLVGRHRPLLRYAHGKPR